MPSIFDPSLWEQRGSGPIASDPFGTERAVNVNRP